MKAGRTLTLAHLPQERLLPLKRHSLQVSPPREKTSGRADESAGEQNQCCGQALAPVLACSSPAGFRAITVSSLRAHLTPLTLVAPLLNILKDPLPTGKEGDGEEGGARRSQWGRAETLQLPSYQGTNL